MTIPPGQAALYTGRVTHSRLRPFTHKLSYRVFSVWLDIDRIAHTAKQTSLFSYNRFGLMAFYDKDHGDRSGAPLRAWVHRTLAEASLPPPGGAIRLLCFPRVFGYVFNPLSIFFCYDENDRPQALIYEVHNTVGGAHAYVAPVAADHAHGSIRQGADKVFYVSPFIGMTARYAFDVTPPSEKFAVAIRESVPEGPILVAAHTGERREFTSAHAAWLLLSHPLMTVKVFAGILWEALFIFSKGARYHTPVPTQGPPVSRGWAEAPLPPSRAAAG